MKKRLIIVVAVILSLSVYVKAKGSELTSDPFTEPTIIRCTCYTDVGITASGSYTRPYIIAGRKEWQAKYGDYVYIKIIKGVG